MFGCDMNAGLFSTVLLRTDFFYRPTQQKTQEEVEDSEALLAKNAVQMSLEVKGIPSWELTYPIKIHF